MLEVYRQLRHFRVELEGRHEDVDVSDLQTGQLLSALSELTSAVHRRLAMHTHTPPVSFTLTLTHYLLAC